MRSYHVRVDAEQLADSISFYSKLFGEKPVVATRAFAKWLLEDQNMNFAITTSKPPINYRRAGIRLDQPAMMIKVNLHENVANNSSFDLE